MAGGRPEAKGYLTLDGSDWEKALRDAGRQTNAWTREINSIAKKASLALAGISATIFAVSKDVRKWIVQLGSEGAADLRSAWSTIGAQVQSQLAEPINRAFMAIADVVRKHGDQIIRAAQTLGGALDKVVSGIEKVASFVGKHTMIFDLAATALVTLGVALYGVSTALAVVNAVMALNPAVLIATAVVALIAVIARLVEKTIGWRIVWIHLHGALLIVWEAVKTLGDGFMRVGRTIGGFALAAWDALKAFGQGVFDLFKNVALIILEPWRAGELSGEIAASVARTAEGIRSAVENADLGSVWEGFAEGHRAAVRQILADTEAAVAAARAAREAGADSASTATGGGAGSGAVAAAMAEADIARDIRVRGLEHTIETLEVERIAFAEQIDWKTRLFEEYAAKTARISDEMWSTISAGTAQAVSFESAMRLKLGRLIEQVARNAVAAELEAQGRAAAQKAAIYGAQALAFLAIGDFRGAAQMGAAAAGMLAVAGGASVAAAALRHVPSGGGGGSGGGFSDERSTEGVGDRGPRRQSIDLTQRSAPETVNINITTNIGGHLVGPDDFADRFIVPRIRELWEGGAFA